MDTWPIGETVKRFFLFGPFPRVTISVGSPPVAVVAVVVVVVGCLLFVVCCLLNRLVEKNASNKYNVLYGTTSIIYTSYIPGTHCLLFCLQEKLVSNQNVPNIVMASAILCKLSSERTASHVPAVSIFREGCPMFKKSLPH